MGRHSNGQRYKNNVTPGAPQQLRSARPPRTVQRKSLAVLGSIAAGVIVAATASAAVGGGKTSGRPSGHSAAYSASAESRATESPVAVGAVAITRVPSPSPAPSHRRRSASPQRPSASSPAQVTTSPPTVAPPTQAPNPVASLTSLPVNTELTGSEAVAWASAALVALGAPASAANVQTMVDWFANEGTPHNYNNPLGLQTPYGGSTDSTAGGSSPSYGIQSYPTPADFVGAFPIEMNNGSYPAIVAAFKAGTGLEGSAATSQIAAELSLYSGGGYDSIPGN